jgi:hypothetical protein
VPPLFALWANLHGGWVMGLGILGVWCAATASQTWWQTRRVPVMLIALPALAFVATILNPYGWRLWQFLAETVGLSRADIGDWQPLFATWDIDQLPVVITIALLAAVSVRARTRPPLPWLLVCAVLIYSSVRLSRVAFVSMPAILLIILPSLALWLPRAKGATANVPRFTALTSVPLAIAVTLTGIVAAPAFRCLPIRGEWIPDAAAVPVLQKGVDGGRIVTFFDWGEYALWHLGPRLKISMDGRRETLYSERLLVTHYSIYDNGDAGHAWLLQQRPEYVWLKSAHVGVRDWLALHGYRVDWQSDRSYVAVRADLPRLSGALTFESSGCFPGP